MILYKVIMGPSGFSILYFKIISILGFHLQKCLGNYLKYKWVSIIPFQLLKVID